MEKEQLKNIFEFLEENENLNKPLKWKLINNEPLRKENLDIEITQSDNFDVNYQITVDGYLVEIVGILNQLGTGRVVRYQFEVGYFDNSISEMYYDSFWKEIENEIVDKFYNEEVKY